MKSKFFNLITISLASSIWVAPAPEAFGCITEPQTNTKQTQHLVHDTGNRLAANTEKTPNQGLVQDGQATKNRQSHPTQSVVVTSQTTDSSQSRSVKASTQVSDTVGGIAVTLLFISYILVGVQYRKYRTHRATILLKQIETLERIWRIKPQQR
jgi:hypothetical protein